MNKVDIKIRKATIKDLNGIWVLVKKLINFFHELDNCYKSFSQRRSVEAFLRKTFKDKNTEIFIAEDNNIIVGYIMVNVSKAQQMYSFNKLGSIWDVYVEKEYRKKGITKQLLRESLKWFRLKKVKNINLSVDSKNLVGVKVWKKLGFLDRENIMFMKLK